MPAINMGLLPILVASTLNASTSVLQCIYTWFLIRRIDLYTVISLVHSKIWPVVALINLQETLFSHLKLHCQLKTAAVYRICSENHQQYLLMTPGLIHWQLQQKKLARIIINYYKHVRMWYGQSTWYITMSIYVYII